MKKIKVKKMLEALINQMINKPMKQDNLIISNICG